MLRIVLTRLQPKIDALLSEEQAGFRKNRSTVEQIFNLRMLMEKHLSHKLNVFATFIDFKKHSTECGMRRYGPPYITTASLRNL